MSFETQNTSSEAIEPAPVAVAKTAPAPELPPDFATLHSNIGNAVLAAAATSDTPNGKGVSQNFSSGLGNAALARMLVQRKPEVSGAAASDAPLDASLPAATAPTPITTQPLILEDTAENIGPGQMKKTEFLAQLRTTVCATTADALADTQWSAVGCPFIDRVFAHYAKLDGQSLERRIRKYAPESASVTTAAGLLPIINGRVRRSLTTWKTTGQITGVPDDVPASLLADGMFGAVGDAISSTISGAISGVANVASGFMSGARSAISSLGSLLFKEREGGVRADSDPQSIQTQLGGGHSLDGGVRSRMESAFGQGFGDVQVHADTNAAGLAENLNARAFTVGQHIAFGTGEYRPGTLVGEALIAHELAHVAQQRGGGTSIESKQETVPQHDALENDADEAAVGAVVSTWGNAKGGLAKIANNVMPSLKSGLRLQRCSKKVPVPEEYTKGPTKTELDENLLNRLEGLHHVYATYRAYSSALTRTGILSGLGSRGAGTALGSTGSNQELRVKLESELKEEGFASISEFEQATKDFKDFFRRYALQAGFQILEENEKLVQGESKRYGPGGATTGGVADLKKSIGPIEIKIEQAEKAEAEARGAPPWDYERYQKAHNRATALEEEARQIAKAMAGRFPILADPDLNLHALVHADEKRLQTLLPATASDRLSDIEETRQNLVKNPELIWQMDAAVARSRLKLGIVQGSIYDALIEDKLGEITIDKAFKGLVIAALAIGLGLISAGTGTAAVLAGAALAGVSVGAALAHTEEYLIQSAASGTSFDRARALTSQEPSLGWLALDIAAAVVDVGAAFKAFRGLAAAAKGVAEGTTTVAALKAQALVVGKELAAEKKVADAAAFAEGVAAAAERAQKGKKLLSASPEAAAAIRLAAAGLDDLAVTGLLRLSPEVRTLVLAKFAGNAEVLARLGKMAEQSEHVVTTVNLLRRNMSDTQFATIIGHYLKTRDIDSVAQMLRAIGQAGVDDAAIKAISASMGKVRTEGGIVKKFLPQIHEAIATKLGPGPDGIKKLLEVTEGLHPNQSGSIFEQWATRFAYGGKGERASVDTSKLAGSYSRNPMTSDNWFSTASGGTVVDYKHLRSAEKFSGSSKSQLDDYARLIKDGATFNSKPITHVEYLFSTREAAMANASKIREVLLDNVTIKYIDSATGSAIVLP